MLAGSFASPGVSAAYTPPPSSTLFITIGDNPQTVGGPATGYALALAANGVLVTNAAGAPILFTAAGGCQINTPASAVPSYTLVCKAIQSGTLSYTFSP